MNATTLPEQAAQPSDIRGTSLGYAINLIMDYGSGRQVTISGTLHLDATLKDMNEKLDMLRIATNRQQAHVAIRDVENTVNMAKHTKAALLLMADQYDKGMEEAIAKIGTGPAVHSADKQQIKNMKMQAVNNRMSKNEEIAREQMAIDKGEAVLVTLRKEIGEG